MSGNNDPIFSRVADIQFTQPIITGINDYTGQGVGEQMVFKADPTNGGFVQRLRFKAYGTNVATVARVFIGPGNFRQASLLSGPASPSGSTASTTGGNLLTGTYAGRVVAVDSTGAFSLVSGEVTVAVTGPTGSINWNWTAVPGAASYRLYVGQAGASSETGYFTTSTNSFTQTTGPEMGTDGYIFGGGYLYNTALYDEISLPATTATATAATVSVDLPMNLALPPGWKIYVGLATAVSAGWQVIGIGGKY